MPKPSVGRIVHLVGDRPIAAMITAVSEVDTIDLMVFPPGAMPYHKDDVIASEWCWPPRVDEPISKTEEALSDATTTDKKKK